MNPKELYEKDETCWLGKTIDLIDAKRYGDIDFESLRDYLESGFDRDHREVAGQLHNMLVNLLILHNRDIHPKGDWRTDITLDWQRGWLDDLIRSPTLRSYAEECLPQEYRAAVKIAACTLGKPENAFPTDCPWSIEDLVTLHFC